MTTWLMKPYSHGIFLKEMRIFNYRLFRWRNLVENIFGILSQRFRCLLGTMHLRPENAVKCVLNCCCLHNLLPESMAETKYSRVDIEDPLHHDVVEGDWHQVNNCLKVEGEKLGQRPQKAHLHPLRDVCVCIMKTIQQTLPELLSGKWTYCLPSIKVNNHFKSKGQKIGQRS